MPPLQRPERAKSISLSPREAMLAGAADVLVVGGGPAGLGAAVGAASAGADVILAERYGFLGGSATVGLVMPMMSFYNEARAVRASDPAADLRLLPSDHGPGEAVIGGVLALFLNQLYAAGGAIPPSRATGYTVPFDPEQYKLVSQKLLDDAGVRFLLHAFASGVAGEGTPEGVVFETKSGPVVIQARAIVDCTGDGDIAAAAGSQFELGRDEDGLVQPMTLMFRIVEFDRPSFAAYAREHPDQWRGVLGLWDLIREAEAAGELDLPREELLFFATPHEREVSVNSTRVSGVGTDVWELTALPPADATDRRVPAQSRPWLRRRLHRTERHRDRCTRDAPDRRRVPAHCRGRPRMPDLRGCDRPRFLPDRHARPPRQRHHPETAPCWRCVRDPAALPTTGRSRPAAGRRTVHFRDARSAVLLPRHADRDGYWTCRRRLRRNRRRNQRTTPRR